MNKLFRLSFLISSSFYFLSFAKADTQLFIPRTDKAPSIDGSLNDECYKNAKEVSSFHIVGTRSSSSINKAYLLCDDSWLYIAFSIKQSECLSAKYLKHDTPVQRDDCIKIMFSPKFDCRYFFLFRLNSANIRAEGQFSKKNGDNLQWDIPWRSAVKSSKTGWDCEIALPLQAILWQNSTIPAINLVIQSYEPVYDNQSVIVDVNKTIFSMAEIDDIFYQPDTFIKIDIPRLDKVKKVFLPSIVGEINHSEFFRKNDHFYYDLRIKLKNFSNIPGNCELAAFEGEKMIGQKRFTLEKDQCKEVTLQLPANSFESTNNILVLGLPSRKEHLQQLAISPQIYDFFKVYTDRMYYTTEKYIRVVCETDLSDEILSGCSIMIKDREGNLLTSKKNPEKKEIVEIPIEAFKNDTSDITAELYDHNKCLKRKLFTVTKLPPNPGCEWNIDSENRVILNNGKPFFPIGMVMSQTNPEDEADFKKIADAGFNTFAVWIDDFDPDKAALFNKTAQKYDLYVLQRPETYCKEGLPDNLSDYFSGKKLEYWKKRISPCLTGLKSSCCKMKSISPEQRTEIFENYYHKNLPRMIDSIKNVKNTSNLIGYNLFDEVVPDHLFHQIRCVQEFYDKLKKVDPYHPCFLMYSSHIPEGEKYVKPTNVLMTDPYWIPGGKGRRATPNFVSQITALTNRRATPLRQPPVIVPCAEYWSYSSKRYLTRDEQLLQTYLAVIHGAKGIIYFSYFKSVNGTFSKQSWDNLKESAAQLNTLSPALTAPDIDHQIAYYEASFNRGSIPEFKKVESDPEGNKFPVVQCALKKFPDGKFVVVAANSTTQPANVHFSISGIDGPVKNLFQNKDAKRDKTGFNDHIEGYGTRAYIFDIEGRSSGSWFDWLLPSNPNVSQKPLRIELFTSWDNQKIPPEEYSLSPRNFRVGRKNLLPNPSFESMTNKEWPDFYFGGKQFIAPWGVDNTSSHISKKSIQMTKTPDMGSALIWWRCSPLFEKSEICVFSCYLKGNKDGLRIRFDCSAINDSHKSLTITKDWKRYSFPLTIPPKLAATNAFRLRLLDNGTVWMNAPQLELGAQPTKFED